MKTVSKAALALAISLCAASPVFAQTNGPASAPIDDPEADILPEILVIARTPGPAWWRVSKGDSVVWIFGLPAGPTPKALVWDEAPLQRRLKGANALLMPPNGAVRIGGKGEIKARQVAPGLRWTNGNVEKDMPPALAERFARARKLIKKPVRAYNSPVPLWSALRLQDDFNAWAGLDRGGVYRRVDALAKQLGVPVRRPPTIRTPTMSVTEVALTLPQAAACFDAFMDATEVPVERHRQVAAGWARGDLRAAVSGPRDPLAICENRLLMQGYTRQSIDIQTTAIQAALTKPGKTVAAVQLRTLLAPNGVLERLKDGGYMIMDPAGLEGMD